jgi:sugar phosphate isomerase/epimerase
MYTRRKFVALAAATTAAHAGMSSHAQTPDTFRGVRIGLESYSMMPYSQDTEIDVLITTMQKLGLRSCCLQEFLLLPASVRAVVDDAGGPDRSNPPNTPEFQAKIKTAEDALKEWRTSLSLDSLSQVRKRFDAARIDLASYMPGNLRTPVNSTDEDLERACQIAQALGIPYMAVMMPKSAAKRFVPISAKHGMTIGFHGRPNMRPTPDIIATPDDYLEVVSWAGNYRIHFDIGNATGGGYNVVDFVRENHQHLSTLLIKDRRTDRVSMPWGQGDSHVKEILQLVRDNRYSIPCVIDCDYSPPPGSTRSDAIAQCLAYAKASLEG